MEDATFDPTTQTYDTWKANDVFFRNFTDMLAFREVLLNHTKSNNQTLNVDKLMIAGMILSIICLILIIVVYSSLAKLRNIHGKNLISLSSCLLITYLLLCFEYPLRRHMSHHGCFFIGVIIHAMFLATFFWTNVMTYNIYKKIFSMKTKNGVKKTSRKYLKYSIYAWSATILATLPVIVLESSNVVAPQYRPKFGEKRCWLSGKRAFYLYFNLPLGIILLGNLIMFILTVRRLYVIRKTTTVLKVEKQKHKLYLYFKLFLVMGIVWFSEFLPWVSGYYKLYTVAGILTALNGVFFFVIFVLNKKIIRQLVEIFPREKAQESDAIQQTICGSQSSMSRWYTDLEE